MMWHYLYNILGIFLIVFVSVVVYKCYIAANTGIGGMKGSQ